MTPPESFTVIEPNIQIKKNPPKPLFALELWSNLAAAARRFEAVTGFALPPTGRSAGNHRLEAIRFEPTVWLIEGDAALLTSTIGDDGALTAIGGGIVRVRLSGAKWRELLMEAGVFNAENPSFGPRCSAATIINHVAVRLHVIADHHCDAYLPASFAESMLEFWTETAAHLEP